MEDTIHDHRARGVVVSHPYSKRKSKRWREIGEGKGGERERRDGTPAGRKIAERGFDPRTFGL